MTTRTRPRSATPPRKAQESVFLRALTAYGWVTGSLLLASDTSLVRALNGPDSFLTLTGVTIPGHTSEQPYFALRRDAIVYAFPQGRLLRPDPSRGRGKPHSIFLVHPQGIIYGTLDLSPRMRVSDFLARQRGFFVVEEVLLSGDPGQDRSRPVAALMVNARHILGVSERSPK